MFEFIRIQFKLDNLSAAQVRGFAPRLITAEQADEIIGGKD